MFLQQAGAEKKAEVTICKTPDGSESYSVSVDSPYIVGATDKYIVVGEYGSLLIQ